MTKSQKAVMLSLTLASIAAYWIVSSTMTGFPDTSSAIELSPQASIRQHFNTYRNDEILHLIKPWTMVGWSGKVFVINAIEFLNDKQINGAIVECGVWKGGLSMLMMFVNQRSNIDRHFYLFDTFQGLPAPTDPKNGAKAESIFKLIDEGSNSTHRQVVKRTKTRSVEEGKWNYGPIDVVRNNVLFVGYPSDHVHFVRGKVEVTLPLVQLPDQIALLRLDTDWYESTKAELDYMWERVAPGGVVIIDDWASWEGAAIAVREFFKEKMDSDPDEIWDKQDKKRGKVFFFWKPHPVHQVPVGNRAEYR